MNWHHCIHVHGDIASSRVWVHGMVIHHSWGIWVEFVFGTMCDAPKLGGPLTTRQPAEYSWMSGNPTPLTKIGQSLLCTVSSTQGKKPVSAINNDHTGSTRE